MHVGKQLLSLAFFIVMVEILIVMLLMSSAKDKIVGNLMEAELNQQKNNASQISQSLKQDLLAVEKMLLLTAQFPEIRSGTAESCNAKLDQVFSVVDGKIGNMVRVNERGIVNCSVNRSAIGIDLSTDELIKKLIEDPAHQPALRRVSLSLLNNKHVAGFHIPVFDENGQFSGTVGGAIYFDELEEKYFKDLQFLDTGYLSIIDDNGDVLYNPTRPQTVGKNLLSGEVLNMVSDQEDYRSKVAEFLANTQNNRPSFIRYHYPPAPEMIAAYYPVEILPNRHWAVAVTVPVEEIVDQLDKNTMIAGFTNFSTLVIMIVIIVFVTQIYLFLFLISRLRQADKRNED